MNFFFFLDIFICISHYPIIIQFLLFGLFFFNPKTLILIDNFRASLNFKLTGAAASLMRFVSRKSGPQGLPFIFHRDLVRRSMIIPASVSDGPGIST